MLSFYISHGRVITTDTEQHTNTIPYYVARKLMLREVERLRNMKGVNNA